MNLSGKSARARKSLSGPMLFLQANNMLHGNLLDYGCGKGFDCDSLGILGYDLNHRSDTVLQSNHYDVISCNYVLNVIESETERQGVIDSIRSLLSENGVAYISVRNDVRYLNGYTKIGTWQGLITLDYPVVKKTSKFIMYLIKK